MRSRLTIILLAIAGLVLGTNGFAQEKKGPGVKDTTSKTVVGQRINAFMVEKIIGSKVINLKGETLGKIENLVIDIDKGRIVYAVLESGGFLGIGDKLLPVPWESLAALPSEGLFFLNQSKEQMEKAPAFDKSKLPDMADMHWGEGIFKHYGDPVYEQRGLTGYGYGYVGAPGYERRGLPGYGYVGYDGYGGYYGDPMHLGPGRKDQDPYKNIFDSKTIKTISGQVIKVDQVSDLGLNRGILNSGIRLTVFVDNKEVLPVYLGPAFHIIGSEHANGFKMGDKVTVTGSQVTVRGELFMLATIVKRGNEVLRLRDKDGTPDWVGWKKASD